MKIFLSSTVEDLKGFRATLKYALLGMGHEPVLIEDAFPNSLPSQVEFRKLIAEVDVFIGVYAYLYGHMPRGEKISIIEKEYRIAVEQHKEILPYVIDPAAEWPDIYREDDFIKRERLDAFVKELQAKHNAEKFITPKDITTHLTPILEKLSVKYDRLKHLKEWAETLDSKKKLNLIHQLSIEHQLGKIPDETLSSSTRLIAGNFDTTKHAPAYRLVDDVEKLLQGKMPVEIFVRNNGSTSDSLMPQIRVNKKTIYSGAAVIVFLLGIGLGSWLFQSQPIAELHPNQPEENVAAIAKGDSAETETKSLKEIPRESSSVLSRAPSQMKTVSNNVENTQSTPSEKLSEAATQPIETGASKSQTIPIDSTGEILASKQVPEIAPNEPGGDREQLAATDSLLKAQIAFQQTDTVTVYQSLAAWREFAGSAEISEAARLFAERKIQDIELLLQTSATLSSPENFLLCTNVNRETRMPEGENNTFSPGQIWMWARVNTPGEEDITANWYVDNKLIFTKTASIPVASPGYRIYFSKTIDGGKKGEIRLFNSQKLLIGRRTFKIASDDVTVR